MVESEPTAIVNLPCDQIFELPSGKRVCLLRPLTGELFLSFQRLVLAQALKANSQTKRLKAPSATQGTIATQWLITQVFNFVEDVQKPIDLAQVDRLDFDDMAFLSALTQELTGPDEDLPGHLPSGEPYSRNALKAGAFVNYQGRVAAAAGATPPNSAGLVEANVELAAKLFNVNGHSMDPAWFRTAEFQDVAFLLNETGKRVAGTSTR